MDSVTFVRSLQLEEQSALPSSAGVRASRFSDSKREARVVAGSLASFTSALQGQQKQDVLNSTLLAQLAANKKYNRYHETDEWYQFYTDVLGKVGWVLQGFKFDEYKSKQKSFQISQLTLELLSALVGEDVELMNVVKETLDSLAKSKDGITLFSSHSTSENHGSFQILPCTVVNQQVSVAFIGSHFKASQVSSDYFFFSYNSQDISLFKAAQVFTLNEDVYRQAREEIIKKLGKHAKDDVRDLPI